MNREIVIEGKDNDWFKKATFVLKEGAPEKMPSNLVSYAEDLIENYLKRFNVAQQAYKKSMDKVQNLDTDEKDLEYRYIEKERRRRAKKKARMIAEFCYVSITVCLISICFLLVSR